MTLLRDSILAVLAIALTTVLALPIGLLLNDLYASTLSVGFQIVVEQLLILPFGALACGPLYVYVEHRRDTEGSLGRAILLLGPTLALAAWPLHDHTTAWIRFISWTLIAVGCLSPVTALSLWQAGRQSSQGGHHERD